MEECSEMLDIALLLDTEKRMVFLTLICLMLRCFAAPNLLFTSGKINLFTFFPCFSTLLKK